ncbi:MAG TPA: MBL fold metallo-hydrolase [Candidatus Limnocylindrales bacterium]|nr:MBL fold metallo-hydrolase [Candidatus Limnocylindrales bacterium]
MPTHLHFLGAAGTVTGSQYLLETDRAKVVIDCGMFQGRPDERIRNLVPLAYDPKTIDAMLLTHAHLDHCGLIPHVVAAGYAGPIYATNGTIELAALVLLDSGKLQEEFSKREMRWERRHPDRAAEEDRQEQAQYETALDLADAGEALAGSPALAAPLGSLATGEHVPTTIEPVVEREDDEDAAVATASRSAPAIGTPQPGPDVHLPHALEPASNLDLDAPLYTTRDARAALARFKPVHYGTELDVAPGVHATFLDAGHILGSAIVVVRVDGGGSDGGDRVIVFSGDLGRPGAAILRDYTTVTDADYVLVETTYGGREHEPEREALDILAQTVRLVADHDGVLLVPSFAIGRTQDIVYALDRLIDEGRIPLLPLYLDSPMGSKATEVYRRHPEYYDDEAKRLFDAGETPVDYPKQIVTKDMRDSEAIAKAPRPYMIVASNGMLTGGRVVGHLRDLIGDPSAVLLFVGYQGVGTLGASLQSGARKVKIQGQLVDVRCEVRSISGFSAHADESQILAWLRGFGDGGPGAASRKPRSVFLVHGDPDAQAAIEPKIRALGLETVVPQWRQMITLE